MKEILIHSKRYGTKIALVDDEDFEAVCKYRWYLSSTRDGVTFYATHNSRIRKSQGGGQLSIFMHRLIAGAKKVEQVDHKNLNTLDNRRDNLRIATHTQNKCNRNKQKNNTSGYKGVRIVILKDGSIKWKAEINVKNKVYHLGHFFFKEDAAVCYNIAAMELHGEFAKLNKVHHV